MEKLLDKHAPMRKMNSRELKRDNKPWITKEILKLIRKEDRCYRKYTKETNQIRKLGLNNHIKIMKNKITQLIRNNKRNYYKEYFLTNKSNIKQLWKGVNEIISTKTVKSKSQLVYMLQITI